MECQPVQVASGKSRNPCQSTGPVRRAFPVTHTILVWPDRSCMRLHARFVHSLSEITPEGI